MEEVKTESVVAENATPDNSVEANAPTENVVPNVLDLLSEELKGHKALQNYDTVDSMAKSLLSAQELVGKRVNDLTAEELVSLDSKFGKPVDITGYDFAASEDFKNKALDLGLNNVQAAKMLDMEKAIEDRNLKSREVDKVARMDEVGKELEEAFGAHLEARVELAKKAALELGGEALYGAIFDEDNLGDPKLIKALSEAGKRIFDHESVGTDQITKYGLTKQEADNEIQLRLRDPEFKKAYMNQMDPGHAHAVQEMQRLNNLKMGAK